MFQNPEAWNDYKRTCLPVLKPARGRTRIPGRIFYGATEEQTNPNTPASGGPEPVLGPERERSGRLSVASDRSRPAGMLCRPGVYFSLSS